MTMFLATIMGWYLIIFSLFVLLRRPIFISVMMDVLKHRASAFILALFTLIIGLLMVTSHNVWVKGFPVLITILSWLILISGVIRIFFLDEIIQQGKSLAAQGNKLTGLAIVLLILGLFLIYEVYIHHAF